MTININDLIKEINKLNTYNNYQNNYQNYYKECFPILYYNDELYLKGNFLEKTFTNSNTKSIFSEKKCKDNLLSNNIIKDNLFSNKIIGNNCFKYKENNIINIILSSVEKNSYTNIENIKSLFYKKLLNDFDSLNLYSKYSFRLHKINKNNLRNSLVNKLINDDIIQLIVNYLNINLVFISDDNISYIAENFKFNIYRPTLILNQLKNNKYQQIYKKNKKVFNSNDNEVIKILKHLNINNFTNNCNSDNENDNKNDNNNDNDNDNDNDYNKNNIYEEKNYNKTNLTKKKLVELQKTAINLKIDIKKTSNNKIGKKNKKKLELITDILSIKKK